MGLKIGTGDIRRVGEVERTVAVGAKNPEAIYAAERQAAMLLQLDRQSELLEYIAQRLHEMSVVQVETNRLLSLQFQDRDN